MHYYYIRMNVDGRKSHTVAGHGSDDQAAPIICHISLARWRAPATKRASNVIMRISNTALCR